MKEVDQTRYSFGEKWRGSPEVQINGVDSFDSDTLSWIVKRNGFESLEAFAGHLKNFDVIMDAGCGNGRILRLFAEALGGHGRLVGFDYASADVARRNLGSQVEAVFDADLLDLETLRMMPSPNFIYCQEVLHHTADPSVAFSNLVEILSPGGEIAIYVYKQKAPIRELTDDYVRNQISGLSHDDAMELAADFSKLGKALTDLDVEVEVPAVRLLGIPSGRYSVQRLVYHFFAKCYWNPELTPDHNDLINFDWYHPSLCSRHTIEEVLTWYELNSLKVEHSYEDEYGITVRGTKTSG